MWCAVWEVEEGDGRGAAPCSRGKHSATLVGGELVVVGGRGAGGTLPLRDVWTRELGAGTGSGWRQVGREGQPPPALQEHSAIERGGLLYVFGGEAASRAGDTPLWVCDLRAGCWRQVAGEGKGRGKGPGGRRGHSAHALEDCMLVYGGYRDLHGSTDEMWAFHYESETWRRVWPVGGAGPARHRHAAVMHEARLYVHGGMSDLRACGDLWHFDTMSRQWRQVRPTPRGWPAARSGHCAARAGPHMYIFGGEVDGHCSGELWRFHFDSEMWERLESGPSPRVDARLLVSEEVPAGRAVRQGARAESPPEPVSGPGAAAAGLVWRLQRSMKRASGCEYSALGGDCGEEQVRRDLSRSRSFCNPHYVSRGQLTPDSGLGGGDLELVEMGGRSTSREQHLLLVGGRETPHVALLQRPLSLWTYDLSH